MITLTSAEHALKSLYLGVISDQLNKNTNPLLAKIQQTSADVWGKEIRKMCCYGINGGVSAGTETGDLPSSSSNRYVQFVGTLKNLYGTIEISDKAVRASENSAGAFVNLLNAEMEGLLRSATFNFSRMLFGDTSGVLGTVKGQAGDSINLDTARNLTPGMLIQIVRAGSYLAQGPFRVASVDYAGKSVTFTEPFTASGSDLLVVQGSFNNEITGLASIFRKSGTLYGLSKSAYPFLAGLTKTAVGEISDVLIQSNIDSLYESQGSNVDTILCSSGVKRAYQKYMLSFKQNIDVMNLEGGYKALSFNGIPLISDRFCDAETMYLLNSADFKLHQLCDWSWLEGEQGRVLRQVPGKPTYTATLVKYADIMCDHPAGQAKLTGIIEA